MDRTEHSAQTMRWNLDRDAKLRWLDPMVITDIDPDTYELDQEGWLRVSRHSASENSAYKGMAILRLKWPNLEFKVRKPTHRVRWKAEIWARRKSS